jgi:hypothetical protein
MKKLFSYTLAITVIATISLAPAEVYAGWELYDNFNSGVINPDLWDIDDSSATISVVGGAVKFEHHPGYPEDASMLIFKQSPETIKAIRATVMVASCTGDVEGNVAGWIGKLGDDYVLSVLALGGGEDWIVGALTVWDFDGTNWTMVNDLHYGRFQYPLDIIGNRFTIALSFFNPTNAIYYVHGLGKNTYEVFKMISPTDDYWKALETWSWNGDGPCVVYFDNVWVLR